MKSRLLSPLRFAKLFTVANALFWLIFCAFFILKSYPYKPHKPVSEERSPELIYFGRFKMGPLQEGKGQTPGVTLHNVKDHKWHFNVLDKGPYGTLPGSIMSNGKPGMLNQNILLGHEALGHGFDPLGPASDRKAVDLENKVRTLTNPQAPQRKQHELD